MSSTKFPCGCKIDYDQNDVVLNIRYCNKHQKLHNPKINIDDNAMNLEDEIFEELTYADND